MKQTVKRILRVATGVIIVALLFSSCISQRKVTMLKEAELQTSFENSKKISYKVQTGDHLYIKIFSVDPKTSKFFQTDLPTLMNPTYLYLNSYVIDEQGYINFSFVDKMYVRGLSIEEVKALIQKTLNEYFKETTVIVRLVNFNITVLGEVKSPNSFTIDKDQINIFQALGMAGGITNFANIQEVKIVRQTLKGSDVYVFDLTQKDILQSDFFYLMPNDVVYIKPYKIKSWAFERFPYELFMALASMGLAVTAILK